MLVSRSLFGLCLCVVVLGAGCSSPLSQYCKEAVVSGEVFGGGGSASAQYDACLMDTSAALDGLTASQRSQANACISCIAGTAAEECGCCTTTSFSTGERTLDIARNPGPCQSTCDTAGQRAFCGL